VRPGLVRLGALAVPVSSARRRYTPHLSAPAHLCPCGQRESRCDECAAWVCRAPGHLAHVCAPAALGVPVACVRGAGECARVPALCARCVRPALGACPGCGFLLKDGESERCAVCAEVAS